MATVLPLNRELKFEYGEMARLSPLVRRVVARNPNAFTFYGTGTYVIGNGKVAVVDPGPLIPEHVEAILAGLKGETVTHILITHTHADHSPAAAPLKEKTGAKTYGFGPHGSGHVDDGIAIEEGGDMAFVPDVAVKHGDVVRGEGWSAECVYTPGHTSNHMCFALREEKALFSGDHVMGWSTTVIGPPDGSMAAYMNSLEMLLARDDEIYYPTHGAPIRDPKALVRALIAHRRERDAQIAACLDKGIAKIPEMVAEMYKDVDKKLHGAAGLSVYAHLIHMVGEGRAKTDGAPKMGGSYRKG